MSAFTFKKEERLKSRKTISSLFKDGKSFAVFPLRLIWTTTDTTNTFPVQFTASVPKRSFPKAVHRNRIRRQVKEAYRLHKHELYEALADSDQQFAFMLLYIAKEEKTYVDIEKSVKKVIKRFIQQLNK